MRFRLAAFLLLLTSSHAAPEEQDFPTYDSLLGLAEEGDLLLIGEAGIWSDLSQGLSRGDQRFGHVGILTGKPGGWQVIDAGGPMLGPGAGVTRRPLSEFVGKAKRIGLFRPALPAAGRDVYLAYAERAAASALPFDREWSLETPEALYCTELVWRALSQAQPGQDPVPGRTHFEGMSVITLGDLVSSPALRELGTAERP